MLPGHQQISPLQSHAKHSQAKGSALALRFVSYGCSHVFIMCKSLQELQLHLQHASRLLGFLMNIFNEADGVPKLREHPVEEC